MFPACYNFNIDMLKRFNIFKEVTIMSVLENLVKLRNKFGYSMEDVANKLGISRQTYGKIENDEAPLTTKQLDMLAAYFGVPVEEFFYGVQNTDKFKQMYLYIVKQFGERGLPKTKLAKLLYLVDFNHFYNNLESMSNVLYKCKEYGPLADSFLELTDNLYQTGDIKIDCLSEGAQMIKIPACLNDFNFSLLSDDEKQEIEAVCEKWKDEPTQVIVNFTHHQKPWKSCRANEVIPYELILQEEPENVY